MQIQTITGSDDINMALTMAMITTIDTLVFEGKLSTQDGEDFKNSKVCMMVDNAKFWSKIRKTLGFPTNEDLWKAVIVSIPSKPAKTE